MKRPAVIALLLLLTAIVAMLHSPFTSHPSGCLIKVTDHNCTREQCPSGDAETYEIEFNFNY